MEKNISLYKKVKENLLYQILLLFPFCLYRKVIARKCVNNELNVKIKEYLSHYSYKYSDKALNMVYKFNAKQLSLLETEIFLPIYSVFANALPLDYDLLDKTTRHHNNIFCVNDNLFLVEAMNRILFSIGGLYYDVDAGDYYSYLKNFKLPCECIKNNYINTYMKKLYKILEEHKIYFTDFEYYIFHRNSAFLDIMEDKRKKLRFHGIKNKYINFFKKNPYYHGGFACSQIHPEIIGINERFLFKNITVTYILKKFRFFFLQKDISFTIFSFLEWDDEYLKCIDEFLEIKKIPSQTFNQDGITITEYESINDESSIEPIITLSSSQQMDYLEYSLKHFRVGNYILIVYKKEKSDDKLPKIFSYGVLINI